MLQLKFQYFGHLMQKTNSLEKILPNTGKDWRQEEKGTTEDEMVGWHHRLNGYEFEETLGDSEEQGSLACHSPWGRKELDTTEWSNNNIEYGVSCGCVIYGLYYVEVYYLLLFSH